MGGRVLLVDDDRRVLDGLRRTLRGRYELTLASSGADGLSAVRGALSRGAPFHVVVSDMMMPAMTGAQFLAAVHGLDPDAVLLILSGQADLASTIAAVNEAGLFRFLTKPCEATDLMTALTAGLRQHQLVVAERELLENTLGGAVTVLAEVLALATPAAAARTARVRQLVRDVTRKLDLTADWRLPIAAMLSQLGCVGVPAYILETVAAGEPLSEADAGLYATHPQLAERLLARIPRLETVAGWVGRQTTSVPAPPTGGPPPPEGLDGDALSEAVFAACTAYLVCYDARLIRREIGGLLLDTGLYPKQVISTVVATASALSRRGKILEIPAADLTPGMVIHHDVCTTTGMILLRSGDSVTDMLATRVRNFASSVGVVEPIHVIVME